MAITKEEIIDRFDIDRERGARRLSDTIRYVFDFDNFHEKMSLNDFIERLSSAVNISVDNYFMRNAAASRDNSEVKISFWHDYDDVSFHADVHIDYERAETDKEVVNRLFQRERSKEKRKAKSAADKQRREAEEIEMLERLEKKYRKA